MMLYVSFEEFILAMKRAPKWRLEKGDHGLTLLTTDAAGAVAVCHSPDPAKSSDIDWALFSQRIGNLIDTYGMMIKP